MQLRLEQIALPPCGGRKQNQPVDRQALRGKDRNQPTFAVTDQITFAKVLAMRRWVTITTVSSTRSFGNPPADRTAPSIRRHRACRSDASRCREPSIAH